MNESTLLPDAALLTTYALRALANGAIAATFVYAALAAPDRRIQWARWVLAAYLGVAGVSLALDAAHLAMSPPPSFGAMDDALHLSAAILGLTAAMALAHWYPQAARVDSVADLDEIRRRLVATQAQLHEVLETVHRLTIEVERHAATGGTRGGADG